MGRLPKKARLSEEEVLAKISSHRTSAKKQAVELLKGCLDSHLLLEEKDANLIKEVSSAIGYVEEESKQTPTRVSLRTEGKHNKRNFEQANIEEDEHNEICEVCRKGGDLICCETCSLVFHLKCIRPKLESVPEGTWSCSYCILDGTALGDKDAAKKALRKMTNIANGYQSEDENQQGSSYRISKVGETSIIQTGKKFLVRKKGKRQTTELGRYNTLTEALSSIPSIQAGKTSSNSGRKNQTETEIWCTKCMDDPTIELCVFCGCKVCFGKNQPQLLVLCDRCNRETHSFCLQPPVNSVPEEDPWYCESCTHQVHLNKPSGPAGDDADFDLIGLDTDSLSIGHGFDDSREERSNLLLSPSQPHPGSGSGSGYKKTSSILDPLPLDAIDLGHQFDVMEDFRDHSPSKFGDHNLFDDSLILAPSPTLLTGPDHDDHDDTPSVQLTSLESVVVIIDQLSDKKLTPNDLDAFEALRMWGSIEDLQQASAALSRQRDVLLNRLSMLSPEVAADFRKKCGILESSVSFNQKSFPNQDRDYINPNNVHQNLSSVNAQSNYSMQHHPNLSSHLNSGLNGNNHHSFQSNSAPNIAGSYNGYSSSYSSNYGNNNYHQGLPNHHSSSTNSHLSHSQSHSYHQAPMTSSYMNSSYSHSSSHATNSYSNYVGVISKGHIPSNYSSSAQPTTQSSYSSNPPTNTSTSSSYITQPNTQSNYISGVQPNSQSNYISGVQPNSQTNYISGMPPSTQTSSISTHSSQHPPLPHGTNNYQIHSTSVPSSSFSTAASTHNSNIIGQPSSTPLTASNSTSVLPNENSQEELASINRRYTTNSTPDVLAGFNQSDLDLLSASPLLFPSTTSTAGNINTLSSNVPMEESKSSNFS